MFNSLKTLFFSRPISPAVMNWGICRTWLSITFYQLQSFVVMFTFSQFISCSYCFPDQFLFLFTSQSLINNSYGESDTHLPAGCIIPNTSLIVLSGLLQVHVMMPVTIFGFMNQTFYSFKREDSFYFLFHA